MKRVIKMSKAWIAACIVGIVLTGCGGGGSGGGGQGAATLSWTAPLTRVNGESIPMGELDKYVIRYGQDAGDLTKQVVVENAAAEADMSYRIGGLATGTWYFTIQVQDINGLISAPSDVVSKSISS